MLQQIAIDVFSKWLIPIQFEMSTEDIFRGVALCVEIVRLFNISAAFLCCPMVTMVTTSGYYGYNWLCLTHIPASHPAPISHIQMLKHERMADYAMGN